METRHIRLDYDQALLAKKHLLSSELNLLRTTRKINTYKLLRKREHILKTKLKSNINILKSKINFLQSYLPKDKRDSQMKIKPIQTKNKDNPNIQDELANIKAKLAELG